MIGGTCSMLSMPLWSKPPPSTISCLQPAPQAALARHAGESERRVRVLRIATTGEAPQRLVGMLIPEPAVEEVVAALSSGGADSAAGEEQPASSGGHGGEEPAGGSGTAHKEGVTPRAGKGAVPDGSPAGAGRSGKRHHRRRHGRVAARRHAPQPDGGSSDEEGGSEERQQQPQPRRMPHRSGRPASMKD